MKTKVRFEVSLPRIDAARADVLGEALVTALRAEERLPRSIVSSAAKLERAHVDLTEATRHGSDPPAKPNLWKAQREEAKSWSALYDILRAMAKLPDLEEGERADLADLLATIFPDGVRWSFASRCEAAYHEATSRLEQIDRLALEPSIVRLGGAVALRSIRRAHTRAGDALGITTPPVPPPAPIRSRDRRDAFLAALREYALQVTAYGMRATEGAEALAARLLAPVTRYERNAGDAKARGRRRDGSTSTGSPSGISRDGWRSVDSPPAISLDGSRSTGSPPSMSREASRSAHSAACISRAGPRSPDSPAAMSLDASMSTASPRGAARDGRGVRPNGGASL
jgi:hypothetical protein